MAMAYHINGLRAMRSISRARLSLMKVCLLYKAVSAVNNR